MVRTAFIIEEDIKAAATLRDTLAELDPHMALRVFKSFDEYMAWFKGFVNRGTLKPEELKPEDLKPEDLIENLALLICRDDALKEKTLPLLKKSRDYFISRGLCTKENPTVFVLTAFDAGVYDFSKYENDIINNILFKPFDKLIVKDHLKVAISQGKLDKSGELYRQKTTSRIEVLKEIKIVEFSEVGFVSVSDREIIVGARAKYYSPRVQYGKAASVYAQCVSCHPHKTQPGYFQAEFHFFNVLTQQITQIRKEIKAKDNYETKIFKQSREPARKIYNVVILTPPGQGQMKQLLEQSFSNIKAVEYSDFTEFMLELDPSDKSSGSKSKDKFLPFAVSGSLFLDPKTKRIVGCDPAPTESSVFLGFPFKKWIDTPDLLLMSKIVQDDRNKLIEIEKKGMNKGESVILRFKKADDGWVMIKLSSYSPHKHEKLGDVIKVEISELGESEKIQHLAATSRFPQKVDILFVDTLYAGEGITERWSSVLSMVEQKTKNKGTQLIFMADKPVSSDEWTEKAVPAYDVIQKPLDAPYIMKRLKIGFPELVNHTENIELNRIVTDEVFKVAQPVSALEVSESGLSFVYHRPIPIGSFRLMCLWLPHEIGLPEFLASCIGVEEKENEKKTENKNKSYICHFIFFGVRDQSLKHIRRWIKDYYVFSKDKE